MTQNELYHFGVPGMKWGVRKSPERYGGSITRNGRMNKKTERPNAKRKHKKDSKYNSFFGTSNANVGKGFALSFLTSSIANIGIRALTNNTDLALSKYYNIGVNVVSGMIGGNVGGTYIRNRQYENNK